MDEELNYPWETEGDLPWLNRQEFPWETADDDHQPWEAGEAEIWNQAGDADGWPESLAGPEYWLNKGNTETEED